MRQETRRFYEKRIEELLTKLEREEERSERWYRSFRQAEAQVTSLGDKFDHLLNDRRQTTQIRKWSIEQAIHAGQPNVVDAAAKIADFVCGAGISIEDDE